MPVRERLGDSSAMSWATAGSQRVERSGRRSAVRLAAGVVVGLVVGLVLAPAAGAKVFVDGKRVTVELVGGISAVPCDGRAAARTGWWISGSTTARSGRTWSIASPRGRST